MTAPPLSCPFDGRKLIDRMCNEGQRTDREITPHKSSLTSSHLINCPYESPKGSIGTPFDRYELRPIKNQNSNVNRLRKNGLALRGDSNAGINPSFGDMVVECVDDHNSEVSDWRMRALQGDTDDDKSLVTSGFLSSDLGEERKNWCVCLCVCVSWEVRCFVVEGCRGEEGRMFSLPYDIEHAVASAKLELISVHSGMEQVV